MSPGFQSILKCAVMLKICGAAPSKGLNQHIFACHVCTCHQGLQQHRLAGPPLSIIIPHFMQDQPAEFTILIMIYFEPTSQANWKDTPLKGDAWSAVALLSGHHTANHQLAYFGSDCGLP